MLLRRSCDMSIYYLLAKIGFGTAENEHYKLWYKGLPYLLPLPCLDHLLTAQKAGGGASRTASTLNQRLENPLPTERLSERDSRPVEKMLTQQDKFVGLKHKKQKYIRYFILLHLARSRLYRRRSLQENIHVSAFFEIYEMCICFVLCTAPISAI